MGVAEHADPKKAAEDTRTRLEARAQTRSDAVARHLKPWIDKLCEGIRASVAESRVRQVIIEMTDDLAKDDKVHQAFREANLVSQIAGRLETAKRLLVFKKSVDILHLSADEAIEEFQKSDVYDEKLFKALLREVEARAGVAHSDLVKTLKEKLQAKTIEALDQGMTYADFADWVGDAENNGLGITSLGDSYLRMAFMTNQFTAYASGKWDQVEEVKQDRPYWQYLTMADGAVRPEHAVLDGAVFEIGNSTDRLVPPLSWNCRCVFISLAEIPDGASLYTDLDEFENSIDPDFEW